MVTVSRDGPSGPDGVFQVTVTRDVGALASGSNVISFNVPGAQVGDGVMVNVTEALDNNIFPNIHVHVLAADTVQVNLFNISGAPVVPGSLPYLFTLFRGMP